MSSVAIETSASRNLSDHRFAPEYFSPGSRTRWGAILAGALAAIGMQLLFTILGIAIGVSSTSVDDSSLSAVKTLSLGAGIWWLITGTVALFLGGLVLGRDGMYLTRLGLYVNAVVLWSVVAVFGFCVLWSGVSTASAAATPLSILASGSSSTFTGVGGRSGDELPDRGSEADLRVGTRRDSPAGRGQENGAEILRATRAACWWGVLGLLAGLAATYGGAEVGRLMCRKNDRLAT